jgi:hypothetical protein
MVHNTPDSDAIANIQQHLENGDHVHLYGDAVAKIAHEVFGKDENHLDVMANNIDLYADDYIVLKSNKGPIYITDQDILGFHVPNQP